MTMKAAVVTLASIGGWIARLILVLAIVLEMYIWLDIFVFKPEVYERLIGGEAGCGKVKSLCSWPDFVLDQVPLPILSILSILSAIALLAPPAEGRGRTLVEATLSEYCCQHRLPLA